MAEQEETVDAVQAGHAQGTDHAHYGRTEHTVTGFTELRWAFLGELFGKSLHPK